MKRQITYSIYTDVGGREVNEDSVGMCQNGDNYCFVLCDGLGGHGMGDIASSLVVGTFQDQFASTTDVVNFIGETFSTAQYILMCDQANKNARKKMKTTGVAAVTDENNLYIGHIGDSRAYVFAKNKVKCRTIDHSIPQMLALSGEIKESEIRNHPDRNIVLRVMGVEWEKNMYELMSPMPIKKCQAVLLCSDGFWELIDEKQMCELLKKAKTVDEWLSSMAAVVKANGAGHNMDNNSAIAVWL